MPVQLVRPVRHETVQVPREQTVPEGQAFPHAPQLFTSVARSRQTPEQLVVLSMHDTGQRPEEHTWPEGQAVPHMPQLAMSL